MTKVILITFGVLGWAWYELSGGADFEPGQNSVQMIAKVDTQPLDAVQPEVSRSTMAASDLTSVAPVRQVVAAAAKLPSAAPAVAKAKPVVAAEPVVPADPEKFAALLDDPAPAVPASPLYAPADYRVVTGSRVNLRDGPATSYGVVTQLLRGEEVEVLDESGDGWVRLRALDGDNIGWMSASFLVSAN